MTYNYINRIIEKYKTGLTTELSFRGDLQDYVERCVIGIQAINEPKRQKCGAPDYIIQKKGIPLGYIETKDLDQDLDQSEKTDQLIRYKSSLENLVLTNYLEFRFFINGVLVDTVKIADLQNGKIKVYESEFTKLTDHIRNFCDYQGQTIKSPKQLANLMAQKAVIIRDVIIKSLELYSESSLVNQRNAFKQVLLHDLTNHTFADMYAQTIAYGLFVARLNDKTLEDFSRQEARELVSKNNPFLRQLFDYISGANLDEDLIWIVEDLVEVFRHVDLNKLLENYGKSTQMTDPFLHFYETFLESYDKVNKKKRGVYYTPQPVVRFIVSAVDRILKTEFNITNGLADDLKIPYKRFLQFDTSKKGKGKAIYEDTTIHKVQILDPATGTGTFLAEAIRKIYTYFKNQQGVWPQYVDDALIPRLNGFEVMMTPYVMCHLKLDLLLQETGYTTTKKTNRFNVYLTNSLDKDEKTKHPLFDWLSEEAQFAGIIKSDKPIMVVLGNPPYSVSSCNKSDYIESLMEVYKQNLNEKNIQPLSDDYIKFIRMGETYIEKNKEGVLAYISNNSFLDGVIHRQMRRHLLETFDKIYILDLHGNAKKKETNADGSSDENVFKIQQGVSINIFIKTGKKRPDEPAKVYHAEIQGTKDFKYDFLNTHEIETIDYKELNPSEPYYFFVPKDFSLQNKYGTGIYIGDLFGVNGSGVETGADSFFVDNSQQALQNKIQNKVIINTLSLKNTYLKKLIAKKKINFLYTNIKDYSYKVFDKKYIYYDKNLLRRAINFNSKHLIQNNLALILMRKLVDVDIFKNVFIANSLVDKNFYSFQSYIFPLYIYNDSLEQGSFSGNNRTPNINMDIVKELEKKLELTFTPEKEDTENTFAPIDVLDYIYGVLHSNKYREKYKEFLKIDFPRIPYPSNADYFFNIGQLGKQLREIHLLEVPIVNEFMTSFPVSGNSEVESVEYKDSKVYINKTQYFDKVPQIAWDFYIGGYQPAQKWLKDRKGRILSYEEIFHYQKIIVALVKTSELMQKIDEVIEV